MQVLIVDPSEHGLPLGTASMLSEIGWQTTTAADFSAALDAARRQAIDAVIMSRPTGIAGTDGAGRAYDSLMRLIDGQRIATVLISDGAVRTDADAKTLVNVVAPDVSLAELRGRFAMIERYHSHFKQMETELRNMERLGKRLNDHFREVDQEMRLASRLQRDFLPDVEDPIGNAQFAAVYRPASWVSGDIFDIFRIDEEHTGFYVADAVGHGMAASLLTMFIRQTIVPKRVDGDRYTIFTPSETMVMLNDALADQSLPNCQFVTACYALLNHRTLTLQYARGGHPYPILTTTDGTVTELKTSGGLLGLFKDGKFPTFETQLQIGDKMLFFTDGVELAFQADESKQLDTAAYCRVFESLAHLPVREMVSEIDSRLDTETGSLNPRDDLTVVGLEILPG